MSTQRRFQPHLPAKIVYFSSTSKSWVVKHVQNLEFEILPERCYIFLSVDDYPKELPGRQRILRHFDAPNVLATKMCAEINGYFGSRSSYSKDEKLVGYSTWMRCLVKMILEKPLKSGKNYKWYEMTILCRWNAFAGTHQVMCIDTPDDFPQELCNALQTSDGQTSQGIDCDPFSMHAPLLDQIVILVDKAVWASRHPIRRIEEGRLRTVADLDSMSDISRHTIHISEVLLLTIQTFEKLMEQQKYVHDEVISRNNVQGPNKEYRDRARAYLDFQIQMLKSLRERSLSNHARLNTETLLAYNRMTLQDNRVVTSIAFLTMIFLPAAFISSFFSTTFFSFGEDGLQVSKQMWLYWAVTIPSTLVILISWRLALYSSAPLTHRTIQKSIKSIFEWRPTEHLKEAV